MTEHYDVLIVGGGHAGAQAAIVLRQLNFEGSVAIVGDEADPPYERPPLSKEYFAGDKTFERLLIRPADFWQDRGIELLLGQKVVSVDPVAHTVSTDSARSIGYGKLIWATGGTPRKLPVPGHDLPGVYGLRSRSDADSIKAASQKADRVVVIGGGYIGLEAASVLRKADKNVVVLEAQERVLARVAGEALSRFFEAAHRAAGVDMRLGAEVTALEGGEHVTGVRLATGEAIPADLVIVGIGIVPAVQPLLDAGASGGNGVEVDSYCRTSLEDVYAIGDCAAHPNRFAEGAVIRLESIQNANDQASTAARAIAGDAQPYESVPWFWSYQFDLRLQTVGLSQGHDETVIRGQPESRSFSVIYLRRGKVVALDCVNVAKDYVHGKALVAGAVRIDAARACDTNVSLKELGAP